MMDALIHDLQNAYMWIQQIGKSTECLLLEEMNTK